MVHFIFITLLSSYLAPLHMYVLVYELYITIFGRVYSYVLVCYSYALVCTRMLFVWCFSHDRELVTIKFDDPCRVALERHCYLRDPGSHGIAFVCEPSAGSFIVTIIGELVTSSKSSFSFSLVI